MRLFVSRGFFNYKYDLEQSGRVTVNLLNVEGKVIQQFINEYQNTGKQKLNLNFENVSNGYYFIPLTSDESTVTEIIVGTQ